MSDNDRFNDIILKCWSDADFKKRFIAEPKKVLAEYGTSVPDNFNVNVVENTQDTMYLVLPPNPRQTGQLSDGELDSVSGGAGTTAKPQATTSSATLTVNRLKNFQIHTLSTELTCTTGKECAPW